MTKNSSTTISGLLKFSSNSTKKINNQEENISILMSEKIVINMKLIILHYINLIISGGYRIDNVQMYGGR